MTTETQLGQQLLTFFIGFPLLIGLIYLACWIITTISCWFEQKSDHSGNRISHRPLTMHEWTLGGPDPNGKV